LTYIRHLWPISPIGPISPMQCFYSPRIANSRTGQVADAAVVLVLVLVDVGRRVQCELLLPHSRSRRFLNEDEWNVGHWPSLLKKDIQSASWRIRELSSNRHDGRPKYDGSGTDGQTILCSWPKSHTLG